MRPALRTPPSGPRDIVWVLGARFLGALVLGALILGALILEEMAIGGSADAQSLRLDGRQGDRPVEIYADDGIEWQRNEKHYIARRNARAIQGDVSVHADQLTARYREPESGGIEVWRLEAAGNVRINSPSETAYGDEGVYDLDKSVLVLTGDSVRFETAEDRITAQDSLEYWEKRQLAVARGDAVATRGNRRLRADVLTARLVRQPDGTTKIDQIDAVGSVHISTPADIVSGDRGVYDVPSGIATLHGSVRITRGEHQLNGEYAEVNLNTGVSRLFSAAPGEKRSRQVSGLLVPKRKPDARDGRRAE